MQPFCSQLINRCAGRAAWSIQSRYPLSTGAAKITASILNKEHTRTTLQGISGLIAVLGLAGFLAACGSDGAPSVSATGSGSGAGSGSASASGTITGFGSVIVNGKKFETTSSAFTVDGQSGSQQDLKIGMMVAVSGSFNGDQRTADTVLQKDAVEGLVQSVASDGLSLIVMGQTVLVDNLTVVDDSIPGRNIRNLMAGTDQVEVNGHIRTNGTIQATFIERKLVNVTPEVRGFVSSHASGSATFRIGNLAVNYSGADISDMPVPNGNNWDGIVVEVKGNNFSSASMTLSATKVELETKGLSRAIDEFEVEGFVTQVGTPNGNVIAFTIGTTPVRTTVSTEFRGGPVEDIVVGAKMSAEGRFDGSTLIAKHVKFHESVRLEGDIAAIGSNTFTIVGLSGVAIAVNSQTDLRGTSLSAFSPGDHVRVRGRISGTTSVVATRIELRSGATDLDLQGPVQSITGNNLVILGISVDMSSINHFERVSGSSMNRGEFLASVKESSLVKVKGERNGTEAVWDEAELED